jgi:ribosomal protein S25
MTRRRRSRNGKERKKAMKKDRTNYMQRRRNKKHKKKNTATFGKRRSELQNEIHRQKQKEVHKPRTITIAACASSSTVVNCALESALHHQHGFIPNEIVLNFASRAGRGFTRLILVHFLSFVLCFVIILFFAKRSFRVGFPSMVVGGLGSSNAGHHVN